MIPAVIHQTWKDRDVPPRYRGACRSWKETHPGWEYRLWTDDDLDALVRDRAPELLPLWERYPDQIQRVDAARYVILREFGGLYTDLDVACRRSMDHLREHGAVVPRTRPLGLSNQLMLSEPGHPLFRRAVRELPDAFERWQRPFVPRHFRVLLTTGPLFVTGVHRRAEETDDVRLLTRAEHGHGRPSEAYVSHLPGDTWAEWDSYLFNFVLDRWGWLAAGAAALSSFAFFS